MPLLKRYVCQLANSDVDCITDKSYCCHKGFLYHQCKPHGQDTDRVVNQLVEPKQCKGKVLSIAHFISLAWQLG